ncbi:hypothetical protein N0V82_004907 [Gnomoniopsis sp. IMI 355080]|nr:hypothetical protein N0V82_004907 [Gnomoniopsis sp. IMI 355080]
MEEARSLVKEMWGIDPDESAEVKFDAYFRFCRAQGLYPPEEVLFITEFLKRNANVPKRVLEDSIAGMQRQYREGRSSDGKYIGNITASDVEIPKMLKGSEDKIFHSKFELDSALATGVRIMLATDLAMSPTSISSHIVQTIWDSSNSLKDALEASLPRLRHSAPSASNLPATGYRNSQVGVQATKLRAKYLSDHAKVEIVWTSHLPDHLDLDGKKLRIFELASYLELSRNLVDESQEDLSACLEKGCFTSQFITETLMTYSLLFHPKDRQWLKSQLKPHRKWSGWGWPTKTIELDQRLSVPFDTTLAIEMYDQPLANMDELYKRYPHWASRLQALYEEAEEPTPSSAIGKWAQRRQAARHTYWVTVAAFGLAIFFGITSTVVGILQLWVSYCQWQEPNGGLGCRAQNPS